MNALNSVFQRFNGMLGALSLNPSSAHVKVLKPVAAAPHLDAVVASQPEEERPTEDASTVPPASPESEASIVGQNNKNQQKQLPPHKSFVQPKGAQQPKPDITPAKRELNEVLCGILVATSVKEDGAVTNNRILLQLLLDPAACQRLGYELAARLHKSGGASVIAGFGPLGDLLMGHVASAYDLLQPTPEKPVVPPVFRFSFQNVGGKLGFVCPEAEQIIRAKSVFLVTPVLTERDSELITRLMEFVEGLRFNALIVGIGSIVSYGESEARDGFKEITLLRVTGLS